MGRKGPLLSKERAYNLILADGIETVRRFSKKAGHCCPAFSVNYFAVVPPYRSL
jgi:hypothetical protein